VIVLEYPATFCECEPAARQWNGYGSCQRCGGAYSVEVGPLAPIVIEPTEAEAAS
jgi:hypothetical protein